MTGTASNKLLIIGASEIAAIAHQYFTLDSSFEPVAFAVDDAYRNSDTFEGLPLIGMSQIGSYPPEEVSAFVAVGDGKLNRIRMGLYARLRSFGYNLASYVSSKAFIWPNVVIGQNCMILEHNVLQPFVAVGDNVVMWSGNHIGHRSVIEDHVFISSHVVISGLCTVGARSFIGVNAAVANGVRIAPDNFIAMSASVTSSTEEDGIYRGNPAERHKLSSKRFCRVTE